MEEYLKDISDGKLYSSNDMVKVGCHDCNGCSACCCDMGESILLDPMDVWRLERNLGQSFEQLLAGAIDLHVEDGLILPNLKMAPSATGPKCSFLNEEGRVFIQGRVSAEDDRASKLILEKIRPFDNMPREIWIQFDNKESYTQQSQELLADLRRSPGDSAVVIYLKDVKAIKKLPVGYHAQIQDSWLNYMYEKYGKTNVKVVERGLKNL
mgnify:CR=1 FL=1